MRVCSYNFDEVSASFPSISDTPPPDGNGTASALTGAATEARQASTSSNQTRPAYVRSAVSIASAALRAMDAVKGNEALQRSCEIARNALVEIVDVGRNGASGSIQADGSGAGGTLAETSAAAGLPPSAPRARGCPGWRRRGLEGQARQGRRKPWYTKRKSNVVSIVLPRLGARAGPTSTGLSRSTRKHRRDRLALLRKLYLEHCVGVHAESASESSGEAVGANTISAEPTPLGATTASVESTPLRANTAPAEPSPPGCKRTSAEAGLDVVAKALLSDLPKDLLKAIKNDVRALPSMRSTKKMLKEARREWKASLRRTRCCRRALRQHLPDAVAGLCDAGGTGVDCACHS